MKHSIDYLNARRAAKPASGGKRYIVVRNRVDDACKIAALDSYERIQDDISETLADINRSIEALRAHARSFDTLAPGECFEDLAF
jgi:hypothetical protein